MAALLARPSLSLNALEPIVAGPARHWESQPGFCARKDTGDSDACRHHRSVVDFGRHKMSPDLSRQNWVEPVRLGGCPNLPCLQLVPIRGH